MRVAILSLSLLLAGCFGGGGEEVAFTATKGRVVTVKEECQIEGAPNGASPRGKCNDIMPKARTQEFRGSEVRRRLTVKFAYSAPGDGELYEGSGEIDQSLSSHVPRPGEELDIWVHPGDPMTTRLSE